MFDLISGGFIESVVRKPVSVIQRAFGTPKPLRRAQIIIFLTVLIPKGIEHFLPTFHYGFVGQAELAVHVLGAQLIPELLSGVAVLELPYGDAERRPQCQAAVASLAFRRGRECLLPLAVAGLRPLALVALVALCIHLLHRSRGRKQGVHRRGRGRHGLVLVALGLDDYDLGLLLALDDILLRRRGLRGTHCMWTEIQLGLGDDGLCNRYCINEHTHGLGLDDVRRVGRGLR